MSSAPLPARIIIPVANPITLPPHTTILAIDFPLR